MAQRDRELAQSRAEKAAKLDPEGRFLPAEETHEGRDVESRSLSRDATTRSLDATEDSPR
jgi:hypothetical protein